MGIQIYVDARETRLFEHFAAAGIAVISKQLEIGDIIIESDSPAFSLIFERKTYADLSASIKDGRYREQKIRLLNTCSPHNCTYIIEGTSADRNRIDESMLNGAVYHTMYRDRMHVLFTDSPAATANLIIKIYEKCVKNPEKFVNSQTDDYVSQLKVKSRKIHNIDKRTCYILQLCQIPGISHIIAKEIAEKFKTWKELIAAIEGDDGAACLTSIPMIGGKKAQNIIEYLI